MWPTSSLRLSSLQGAVGKLDFTSLEPLPDGQRPTIIWSTRPFRTAQNRQLLLRPGSQLILNAVEGVPDGWSTAAPGLADLGVRLAAGKQDQDLPFQCCQDVRSPPFRDLARFPHDREDFLECLLRYSHMSFGHVENGSDQFLRP